jgi:hypothetical protein
MLEGPIKKNTSWHVAGRRSYADLFLPLAADENVKKSILHFYDLNAKVTHRFSPRDMVQVSGYYGSDALGLPNLGRVDYGNGTASILWRHRYSDRLVSRLGFNFSDFTLRAKSSMPGITASIISNIRDYQLRMDFEHEVNRYWNFTYGFSSIYHTMQPGKADTDIADVSVPGNSALENTVYVSNQQTFGRGAVTLRYGVRLSMFSNMGEAIVYRYNYDFTPRDSVHYAAGDVYKNHFAAEPRVGMLIRTGQHSSIKASYAYNTQFMQLANNSASGSPLDIWFTAGSNIAPQRSHLVSVGYFHNLRDNMFALSVELYYKEMKNVIDFKDGANLLLNTMLDGEVRSGRGRSYGAEFSVAKTKGRVTGFINYTLSRSTRTIRGINGGRTFPAPFDKPHVLNVALMWQISRSWDVALSWIYATGNPTTEPIAKYRIDQTDVLLYSARNAYRMPAYHRMDFSVTWHIGAAKQRRWRHELNMSFYNVYNHKNPWIVQYKLDELTARHYKEMIYLFGVVPSLTYNFKF